MHEGELEPLGKADHLIGSLHAPLLLVEYGDFECKFTRAAFAEVERIRGQLGPRLRYAFRHFPLPKHPHAEPAAEAAEAAAAQGEFWSMYRLLFTRREVLELRDPGGIAEELAIDPARFVRDLDDHLYRPAVHAQRRGGARAGVEHTPTFFINGRKFEGEWRDGGLLAALGSDTEAAWY